MKKIIIGLLLSFSIICVLKPMPDSDVSDNSIASVAVTPKNPEATVSDLEFDSIAESELTIEEPVDTNRVTQDQCSLILEQGTDYDATKNEIVQWRANLYKRYLLIENTVQKERFLDSVSILFSSRLLNDIVPYWYGTEWDFNGYTAIPNKGVIACGYFVSTTLQHMGVNINRYRLAQQAGSNICKTLALGNDHTTIYKCTYLEDVYDMLNKIDDGLYFTGLDNHVGYFYKKRKERYFINSNYIDDKVVIEHAKTAGAFMSNWYYFTNISSNHELMLKWLKNTEVVVVR